MGQSMEGIVIDNDMMCACLRVLRGIEVTDESLSLKEIESAVFGDGHFLNQPQTLEIMRTEYLYPEVADRSPLGDWEESGSPTVYDRAHDRVKEILSRHYPEYIDPAVDSAIRDRFPIQIPLEAMKPGNGRWD